MYIEISLAESRFSQFVKQLKAINVKAEKYGCEPFTYKIVSAGIRQVPTNRGEVSLAYRVVGITGHAVQSGSFTLAAGVFKKGSVLETKFYEEGLSIPKYLFEDVSTCNHCNQKRNRTQTFIVVNKGDGRAFNVGKTCLYEYTGISLQQATWGARLNAEIDILLEAESERFTTGIDLTSDLSLPLQDYLEHCAQSLLSRPPYFKGLCFFGGLDYQQGFSIFDNLPTLLANPVEVIITEEAKALTASTLELARQVGIEEYVDSSEQANTLELLSKNYLTRTQAPLGYWLLRKELVRQLVRKDERVTNLNRNKMEYVSQVGARGKFTVRLVAKFHLGSNKWGETFLYKFEDEAKNSLVWKTAKSLSNIQEGWEGNVTATVKEHTCYKDQKQTELFRVKFE